MHLFSSHANLDDTGIVLDELSHGFPPQAPHARKLADAVVLLEGIAIWQSLHSLPYQAEPRYQLLLDLAALEEHNRFRG